MVSRSRARGLGAELRELRKLTGLTIIDLGKQVGLSKSTIARVETGERVPDETEIALICGALGVTGARRDALLTMAQEAHKPNWLATGVAGLPEQLTTLVDYELSATSITEMCLVVVPGLLQTREYARAIYSAAGVPGGEIATRATIRMGRQEILTKDEPVEFCAVIDESALRRPIGGVPVAVSQLHHLQKMSGRPNITIQVLPNELGAHAAVAGSYVLLEFAKESPVVHLEQYRAGAFLDEREDVEAYGQLTERLRQQALSPADSAGLVSDCIAELESTA